MTAEGGASGTIAERLAGLEEQFSHVTVNQTNFEVDPEQYAEARAKAADGRVDVHVLVRNETDDVLLREDDGEWAIPRGTTRDGESPTEAADRVLEQRAPVEASVDGVAQATITGISSSADDDPETVYRLSVVFVAEVEVPAPGPDGASAPETGGVRWDANPPAVGIEFS